MVAVAALSAATALTWNTRQRTQTALTAARERQSLARRYVDEVFDQVASQWHAKPEDLSRFHGTNERIGTANLAELVRFYHQLLSNASKAPN